VEQRRNGIGWCTIFASRHVEDEVWSVLVAGYVLGYSLTMKSENNDKTRVMIIITIITSTMSRHGVSIALIWGIA